MTSSPQGTAQNGVTTTTPQKSGQANPMWADIIHNFIPFQN